MKLEIDDTIEHLENIKRPWTCVREALQVCKMWKEAKRYVTNYKVTSGILRDIEETYFKPLITQTVTVKIQGEDESRLDCAIETIKCINGVKEVRPHETRY